MCSKNNSSATIFHEGFIETISFSVPLFFRPQFVYRKDRSSILSFYFQHEQSKAQAVAYFSIEDQRVLSLAASPFGSVYGNEYCTTELLCQFINQIKQTLIQRGFHTIDIRHYPACYNEIMHDRVLEALSKNGFEITCTENNQYLPLEAASKKEIFDHSKLHLIKKCREEGFKVSIAEFFDAEKWYDIILRARKRRAHPMTIDLDSLRDLNKNNEDSYHFFEVKDGNRIIACAIGVQVTEDVLYYYLAADEEDYRNYSPMTFLLNSMYDFACEKGLRILDMGISSSHGIINEGLRWFKKSFGAIDQPKVMLQWKAEKEAGHDK